MSYTKEKKISINNIADFASNILKKKINEQENLFKVLDSLEIMTLLSGIEKEFKLKVDMIKILNKKKLDFKKQRLWLWITLQYSYFFVFYLFFILCY